MAPQWGAAFLGHRALALDDGAGSAITLELTPSSHDHNASSLRLPRTGRTSCSATVLLRELHIEPHQARVATARRRRPRRRRQRSPPTSPPHRSPVCAAAAARGASAIRWAVAAAAVGTRRRALRRRYHPFCWFILGPSVWYRRGYEADAAGDCDFGGLLAGATYNATDPNPNLDGYTAAWADYNASDPNATAPYPLPRRPHSYSTRAIRCSTSLWRLTSGRATCGEMGSTTLKSNATPGGARTSPLEHTSHVPPHAAPLTTHPPPCRCSDPQLHGVAG